MERIALKKTIWLFPIIILVLPPKPVAAEGILGWVGKGSIGAPHREAPLQKFGDLCVRVFVSVYLEVSEVSLVIRVIVFHTCSTNSANQGKDECLSTNYKFQFSPC